MEQSKIQEDKKPSNEVRIGFKSRPKALISYCEKLLKEEKVKELHLTAVGNSITKLVTTAEILKIIIPGLYQQNRFATVSFQSVEEGQKLELNPNSRLYPKLEILLSLEEPKEKNEGTQDKLSEDERKKLLDAWQKQKESKKKVFFRRRFYRNINGFGFRRRRAATRRFANSYSGTRAGNANAIRNGRRFGNRFRKFGKRPNNGVRSRGINNRKFNGVRNQNNGKKPNPVKT